MILGQEPAGHRERSSEQGGGPVGRRMSPGGKVALVAAGLYMAAFVWRTSFLIEGKRFFCLFDDAMVSMNYARNLASGLGLVWTPGSPPIEGFSNPLWTAIMAVVHLFPIPVDKASLPVQLLSLSLLLVNLVVVARLARLLRPESRRTEVLAVVLVGFYYPLNNWALQGMEVGLAALLVSWSLLLATEALEDGGFRLTPLAVLAGATFVRMDLIVPLVAVTLYLAVMLPDHRRRYLAWGLSLAAGAVAAQTVARVLYFGDPLPNTYYLKLTGFPLLLRVSRGLAMTAQYLWNLNWLLVAMIPLAIPRRFRRQAGLWLAVWAAQLAYSTWVGGDAWEWWVAANRFVTVVAPAFLILVASGLDRLAGFLVARVGGWIRLQPARAAKTVVAAVFCCLAVVDAGTTTGLHGLKELALVQRPLLVGDNAREVRRALGIAAITEDSARVAVVWAGIIPYFSRRPGVDLLGKCDRRVARLPARVERGLRALVCFYPGHDKYDYEYSLGELRPDVVSALWRPDEHAARILKESYRQCALGEGLTVYLRAGSREIRWSELSPGEAEGTWRWNRRREKVGRGAGSE